MSWDLEYELETARGEAERLQGELELMREYIRFLEQALRG